MLKILLKMLSFFDNFLYVLVGWMMIMFVLLGDDVEKED